MKNTTTQNGGCIKVDGDMLEVITRAPFTDGTGVDDACPYCLHTLPNEVADIVQYGIISNMHEIVYLCHACNRYFVLEVEIPA
jgi:uncharacterized protein with PIN domain